MRPLWLDAAALRTLVDDLTGLQLQTLHVLLGGVALGHCPLTQRGNKKEHRQQQVNTLTSVLYHQLYLSLKYEKLKITFLSDVYFAIQSRAGLEGSVGQIWPTGRQLLTTALELSTCHV